MAMEVNKLHGFVLMLVLVALLVGVGILILNTLYTTGTFVDITRSNESFVMPEANASPVALSHSNMTGFIAIREADGTTMSADNYTIVLVNGTVATWTNTTLCTGGSTCYAFYNWRNYDTLAGGALDAMTNAIGTVSTIWLSLIVTIVIAAIILGIVMSSFRGGGGRY